MKDKFSIHYVIKSSAKYLASSDALKSRDLSEVFEILPLLHHQDDTIYISLAEVRVKIWCFDTTTGTYNLEFYDGRKSVCFSKSILINELEYILKSDFLDCINHPLDYGFTAYKFLIHYIIKSSGKYLDHNNAIKSKDLSEVFEILPSLHHQDDTIYIYIPSSGVKVQIWYFDSKTGMYELEFHDGRKAVCFSKNVSMEELEDILKLKFLDCMDRPLDYGFTAQSF